MSRNTDRSTFKAEVLPNIEPLLQISLWLTRNGLDASQLMREALSEAYRLWSFSAPKESCGTWLQRILISRFSIGIQTQVRLTTPSLDDTGESLPGDCPITSGAGARARHESWVTGDSTEDGTYLEAIASLPAVCRSAMILSYLEGFSNKEIADLAGVKPDTIASTLSRGRRFIREEIFEHLMGPLNLDGRAKRKAASGGN